MANAADLDVILPYSVLFSIPVPLNKKDGAVTTVYTIVPPFDGVATGNRKQVLPVWDADADGVPLLLDNSQSLHSNELLFSN